MDIKQSDTDLTLIGGGPAGYVAAIRAAQKGLKVTLVEKRKRLGGTCLNVGCIPTKVLVHAAEIYKQLSDGVDGISCGSLSYDWGKINDRREKIVRQLSAGVENLLRRANVQILIGEAKFESTDRLVVQAEDEEYKIKSDKIVIATGSKSMDLPVPGGDNELILDSTRALELAEIPKSMAIIGGGVIGIEFACIFGAFGTKITIIEMMPQILPGLDFEVAKFLRDRLVDSGIEVKTNTRVNEISFSGKIAKLKINNKDGSEDELLVDTVLQAVGRMPNTDGLGLENVGVETNGKAIVVDEFHRTNIDNIYAIGDVTGPPMLAHRASAQGLSLIDNLTKKGIPTTIDNNNIPGCIYSMPEVATVGLTEEEAGKLGYRYKTGRFPLYANGKTLIESGNGFVKIVVDAENDTLLGMHMVGPKASEIIGQGAIAISMQMTSYELENIVFPHPTVSEAFGEAVHAVSGFTIHIPRVG